MFSSITLTVFSLLSLSVNLAMEKIITNMVRRCMKDGALLYVVEAAKETMQLGHCMPSRLDGNGSGSLGKEESNGCNGGENDDTSETNDQEDDVLMLAAWAT